MTIETYFTMNARITAILRQGNDPMALYAAQRIEELERISGIRYECLEIATQALEYIKDAALPGTVEMAISALDSIEQRLAQLEEEAR
jgi:hypothetical protein